MSSFDNDAACTILDIGSSEGGNAVYAMKRLVDSVRSVSNSPIWVFLSDLPTNDFNHLFANLFPQRRRSSRRRSCLFRRNRRVRIQSSCP